jgi:hypothetical protein
MNTLEITTILNEIQERFYLIPFENSTFQNKNFVITAQQTPGRAYRAIGLKMMSKLQAIEELKYNRLREEIDIEELEEKIKSTSTSEFDKRRAAIDIQQKLAARPWADKLLNDAIEELNFLYSELQKYPKYNREMFEAEEREHFEAKLRLQLETNGNGAVESLVYMDIEQKFEQLLLEKQQNALE